MNDQFECRFASRFEAGDHSLCVGDIACAGLGMELLSRDPLAMCKW